MIEELHPSVGCYAHAYHRPEPLLLEAHHRIPLAWTRQLGLPESPTVALCPTGHDNVHVAIRHVVRGDPLPARFGERTRELIGEASTFWLREQARLPAHLVYVR